MNKEQKIYKAPQNVFTNAKIEGEGCSVLATTCAANIICNVLY